MTVLISPHQFALRGKFLASGYFPLVQSGYVNQPHNFLNLVFVVSSVSFSCLQLHTSTYSLAHVFFFYLNKILLKQVPK